MFGTQKKHDLRKNLAFVCCLRCILQKEIAAAIERDNYVVSSELL